MKTNAAHDAGINAIWMAKDLQCCRCPNTKAELLLSLRIRYVLFEQGLCARRFVAVRINGFIPYRERIRKHLAAGCGRGYPGCCGVDRCSEYA